MIKKYTKEDKRRILNYFYKKEEEYSTMPIEELKSIAASKYVHNGKKLSSTELIAYEKVMKSRKDEKPVEIAET